MPNPWNLSPAEERVVAAVRDTGEDKCAGKALGLSPRTIETHMHSVCRKMGVRNRVVASVLWDRHERATNAGNRRPIGARVREVCAIAERLGPSTHLDVFPWVDDSDGAANVYKYLLRATDYGLMTMKEGKPRVFQVVPGWREKIEAKETAPLPKPKPRAQPCRPAATGKVNSVWALAAGTN